MNAALYGTNRGFMGFWREPLAWWIGPVDAWERKSRAQGGMLGTDPVLNYELYRRWPVAFRDWDSLTSFLTLVSKFAMGNPAEISDGVTTYKTADEFFGRPNPLNLDVTIIVSAGTRFFKAQVTAKPQYIAQSREKYFVSLTAREPQYADANQIWVADVVDAFDSLTRPMTLLQRVRRRPVVTKRTEAEYYADRRAAKVRWQSWALGIFGGFFGAALAFWAGFKP